MRHEDVAAVVNALGGFVDPHISGPLGNGRYAIRAYFPDVGVASAFRAVADKTGMRTSNPLHDPDGKTVCVTFDDVEERAT